MAHDSMSSAQGYTRCLVSHTSNTVANLFFPKRRKGNLEELMDDDELREMIGKAPLLLETGKDLVCHPCPTTFVEINKKQTGLGV